ncbi:hypothetical protein H6G33_10655 [Calothrix sp. FACHB-1219]|uniref:hypothetical protein n=1 Tax=unclassified Calothrix TaxID=2619626 RepID=UPI001682703D|nr:MULTISPECIES: hypothetical protein [unclassified Calothrix]MBD2201808.1 hypothetical protein [Calothrix sp. FACHB-168]MBD2217494.1 hypothetical protein [Calothrix sp. FACHB-1219]
MQRVLRHELDNTIDKSLNEIKLAQEAIGKSVLELVVKQVRDVIEYLPDSIVGITWTQYTPFFNDGDPCTFRVNDPQWITKAEENINNIFNEWVLETIDKYGEDVIQVEGIVEQYILLDTWSCFYQYLNNERMFFSPDKEQLFNILQDIEAALSRIESYLEDEMGGHSEIYIFKDKIVVEEYLNHD